MIRFFITRFILPLLLFWLLRMIFKSVSRGMSSTAPARQAPGEPPSFHTGGELKKDPVCGTYVSPDAAVNLSADGKVLYFCSTACRDKYHA